MDLKDHVYYHSKRQRNKYINSIGYAVMAHATDILTMEAMHLGIRTMFNHGGSRIKERLRKEISLADQIVTPSQAAADSAIALSAAPSKVKVLPFGVILSNFISDLPSQTEVNRKFCALFVGKFGFGKGVHYLLEAWKRAALKHANCNSRSPTEARFR